MTELQQTIDKIDINTLEELDFDLIADVPMAMETWQKIESLNKKAFLYWCKIVINLGGISDETNKWCATYQQTVADILGEMILDVVRIESSTIDKIETSIKKLKKICAELQQPMPLKIGDGKQSLFDEEIKLKAQVEEYQNIVKQRIADLEELQAKQNELLKYFNRKPTFALQYPPLPTPEQLHKFKEHIEQLDQERFERDELYCAIKTDILKYVNNMKYLPMSDFERKVLCSDSMRMDDDNMKKLNQFVAKLKEKQITLQEDLAHMRSKLEEIWKLLDVDLAERDEFRTRHAGNTLDTLSALKAEFDKCEGIRKANVKIYVDKARRELEAMWAKCHCTEAARRQFRYFHDDCYTEDLLELHDLEIQRWHRYYNENAKLLSLLEKHSKLWARVNELEENAAGPNRYKNRGGQLLQEEKERNRLSKLIPKIEDQIRQSCEEYKARTGEEFLSYGQTAEEYITHLYLERENNRKLKLSALKKQRDTPSALTPSCSKAVLFPSTSQAVTTPMTPLTTKRKIFTTPNTDKDVKRLKVLPTSKSSKRPAPKITVTQASFRKRFSKERRMSSRKNANRSTLEDLPHPNSYSQFQSELSKRDDGRSTILPTSVPKRTPKRPLAKTAQENCTPSMSRTPRNASKSRLNLF